MPDVLFYHLQRVSLDKVLPGLLERSLERGWRCCVEASQERAKALDDLLWTYADDSFLPHGLESDDGEHQPVVLVSNNGNPNAADIRFLVDGALIPENIENYQRIVLVFDGTDSSAIEAAREQWKLAQARGLAATYWQQNDAGRWEKRA